MKTKKYKSKDKTFNNIKNNRTCNKLKNKEYRTKEYEKIEGKNKTC